MSALAVRVGAVFAFAWFEQPCIAQPVQVPHVVTSASSDAPYYDAEGATLPEPPAPPRKHPFIVAPSVDVGVLAIPSLSSNAILIEPMAVIGNDFWGFGVGYANLADRHGVDFDGSMGEWASGIRLFEARGWVGSWLMPDVHARFSVYPSSGSQRPSWVFGGTLRAGGLRFAKCLGKASFEMSMSGAFGPMMVKIDSIYAGVVAGGHLDVGVAL